MALPRPLAAVIAVVTACAAFALDTGARDGWPVGVRAPLALALFVLLPGLSLLGALRLRLELASYAAVAVALSLALDLLGATALVVGHTATLPHLLLVLGGVSLASGLAIAVPRGEQ